MWALYFDVQLLSIHAQITPILLNDHIRDLITSGVFTIALRGASITDPHVPPPSFGANGFASLLFAKSRRPNAVSRYDVPPRYTCPLGEIYTAFLLLAFIVRDVFARSRVLMNFATREISLGYASSKDSQCLCLSGRISERPCRDAPLHECCW